MWLRPLQGRECALDSPWVPLPVSAGLRAQCTEGLAWVLLSTGGDQGCVASPVPSPSPTLRWQMGPREVNGWQCPDPSPLIITQQLYMPCTKCLLCSRHHVKHGTSTISFPHHNHAASRAYECSPQRGRSTRLELFGGQSSSPPFKNVFIFIFFRDRERSIGCLLHGLNPHPDLSMCPDW